MLGSEIRLDRPLAMRATLGPLQQGRHDPSVQWVGKAMWRATRTPTGPVTTRVEKIGERLLMSAWGDGAEWAVEHLEELVGQGQDDSPFGHDLLDELLHRNPGIRIPRSRAVFEATVWTVIAQRVTSGEAVSSWQKLLRHFGRSAPTSDGSPRLLLPPTPEQVAGLTSWQWHSMGVERKRGAALRLAARCAHRLEEAVAMPADAAIARLSTLPGLGIWTAHEVAQAALGDCDAFSIGDYHLKNQVGFALAGRQRSTDAEMIELLEPFRPRRGLAVRLIVRGHERPQAFGPRYSPIGIAAL